MHHRAKATDEVVERARQLHDDGMGYKRIAGLLNISRWTVRDWCTYRTR